MDDLWGNAWSDPPPQPTKPVESPKTTTWAATATASDERHEVPSLSLNGFGSVPAWGASTTTTTNDSGLSWGVSTLNIAPGSPLWGPKPLGSPKLDAWRMDDDGTEENNVFQDAKETTEEEGVDLEEKDERVPEPDADAAVIVEAPVINEPPPPEPSQDLSTPLPILTSTLHEDSNPPFRSPPGSPEGFGGFESGHTVSAWSPPSNTFRVASFAAEEAGWGGGDSHWGPSTPSASQHVEPPADEWAAAREPQHRAEAGVPQVVLDTILAEWSELSLVLFPSSGDKREDDDEAFEGGLEQVPGLVDLLAIVAPSDPQLPPPSHIPSTTIHKQMTTAIKLTRHIPISNLSPLNQLFASKGSTAAAWEHAVRTHVVKASDDWSWMGGKPKEVLEAEEKEKEKEKRDSTVVEKKGLLASLWGRSSTPAAPTSAPAAAEKPATEAGSSVKPATPELPSKVSSEAPLPSPSLGSLFSSSDVRRSSDSGSILSQSGIRTSTPSLISAASTAATSSNSSIEIASPTTAAPSTPAATPSTATTAAATPAPQSAVSRFLGRFGRSRTPTNSQFGQTVSLTDADFSFLEEVPTVGEDDTEDDKMKAFEDLLGGSSTTSKDHAVLTKRPVSMISGRMPVPVDSPPRLGPPPKGPKSVGASPAAPLGVSAGMKGQEKEEEEDIWAVFEKPAAPTRKSTLPVMGRPGSVQFGSSASRPNGSTTPIARMVTKHSAAGSLPPILAPPPRLSAPPSRSTTPLPPSPATSGSAVPTIPPPNALPLITPSIIARRATNATLPLPTSSPSIPSPMPASSPSAFDDFGDFLDSGSTATSTATATPSDPLFSLGSPLPPISTAVPKPALSPLVTRPTPTSARSSNGFGSFGDRGDDGFGDFMSPAQQQPTPPATQFAISPWPVNSTLTPNNANVATLGMPSPRITAPDTPLYPPDPNKPLPPPRSLSPLLKKVANTQSDKWPKPDHAPVGISKALPPALAPPPGGSGFRKPQAPAQDLLAMGSPLPDTETKQGGGGGSVFAMMQAQAPSPVVASGSSFIFPPPPGGRQTAPSAPPANPVLSTLSSLPVNVPASVVNGATNASGKGGLSAADLSFFEGL
ncbi:hypothetical protein M407DRAFT_19063 [Tulasnella calospora MUT 4182]|uniref:Uncharacterized protein n=1 Tax=Tulasnella calospora MUT 4182 TaxID=1051891 RepID=A0A0C3ME44_9AGAM|nr:hypothetical protein M407DRAFT_19063 [Tulasnella calospora MUT 4182]